MAPIIADPMLEAALEYARLGYRVFPLKEKGGDGNQLLKSWPKGATTDEATIRRWWKRWPTANVAIATGQGCSVLDVDVKKADGPTILKDRYGLEVERLAQMTPSVRTPSGGWHFYHDSSSASQKNSLGELGPSLDVKTAGGYVVAPPSVVEGNAYRWVMPLSTPRAPWPRELLTKAEGEGRNVTLTSQVGLWFHQGKGEDEVASLARDWNAEHFDPPLDEREVETIVASIAKKHASVTVVRATEPLTIGGLDGMRIPIGPLIVVGSKPSYHVTVAGKLVKLTDTKQLMTVRDFVIAVFRQTGLIVVSAGVEWLRLLQQLRDRAIVREVRADEDGELAVIREQLDDFLEKRHLSNGIEDVRLGRPALAPDRVTVVFAIQHFESFLRRHSIKPPERGEMTDILSRLGCKKTGDRLTLKDGGTRDDGTAIKGGKAYLWGIPEATLEREQTEPYEYPEARHEKPSY